MNRPEAGMWPLLERADDPWPWAWPDDDLGYADAAASPWLPPIDPEIYRRAAMALQDGLDAIKRGHRQFDTAFLESRAAAASVSLEARKDRRPAHIAPRLMSVEEVARMGLDGQPDAGLRGTDEVLGPWVESLHPQHDREILLTAVAHWCLSGSRSTVQAWTRSRPTPSHPERAAARALIQAPLNLWRVQRQEGGWRVEDQIGIAANRHPTHPLSIEVAGSHPLSPGDLVLARAVPTASGWHAWGALRLPRALSPDEVGQTVLTVLAAVRLRNRRATLDDVLRLAGHRVAQGLYISCYRLTS